MAMIVKVISHEDRVYVESTEGERWCEVKGGTNVDRVRRGQIIAGARSTYGRFTPALQKWRFRSSARGNGPCRVIP